MKICFSMSIYICYMLEFIVSVNCFTDVTHVFIKHVWNTILDTQRDENTFKTKLFKIPFSWTLNSVGKEQYSACIQVNVCKSRSVCDRCIKTEQKDDGRKRRMHHHHYCKGQTGVWEKTSVKQGHDLNSKLRTEIISPGQE